VQTKSFESLPKTEERPFHSLYARQQKFTPLLQNSNKPWKRILKKTDYCSTVKEKPAWKAQSSALFSAPSSIFNWLSWEGPSFSPSPSWFPWSGVGDLLCLGDLERDLDFLFFGDLEGDLERERDLERDCLGFEPDFERDLE